MSSMRLNAGDVKRIDMLQVDPFQIIVKEELRGRCEPPAEEEIIALAESMMVNTQLEPVQVRKLPDHRLQLTLGFSRMAAARLIRTGFVGSDGESRKDERFAIKCIVALANDETAFINNVVENCHRNQTSDVDDAHNQNRLRERYGWSDADIAKLYKDKSGQRVARLKLLLQVPKEIQDMVQSGEMSTPAVAELMQLPEENRSEAIEQVKAASSNGKVSAPAMRAQVRDHHLRDEENAEQPALGTKPAKERKASLTLAELRAFVSAELDAAEDVVCVHGRYEAGGDDEEGVDGNCRFVVSAILHWDSGASWHT